MKLSVKNIIIKTLFLFVFVASNSQISVSSVHVGKLKDIEQPALEKFKNSKTIFVLSKLYDKDTYEQILKDSWTVTPYEIIDYDDFDIRNFLNDKYSIVHLGITELSKTKFDGPNTSTSLKYYTYLDIKMYNNEEVLKKLKPDTKKRKVNNILSENTINIARFYLFRKYASDDGKKKGFQNIFSKNKMDDLDFLYKEQKFYNYTPGFLKNYFQKINSLLAKGENYWMYGDDYKNEIGQLKVEKLFVPSYLKKKYEQGIRIVGKPREVNLKKVFKNYDFEYEVISDDILSEKIMKGEEFLYLRYVRMNSELFLQVVNSKTGEIVYRDYIPGLAVNIKSKHIEKLNKEIKRF